MISKNQFGERSNTVDLVIQADNLGIRIADDMVEMATEVRVLLLQGLRNVFLVETASI